MATKKKPQKKYPTFNAAADALAAKQKPKKATPKQLAAAKNAAVSTDPLSLFRSSAKKVLGGGID